MEKMNRSKLGHKLVLELFEDGSYIVNYDENYHVEAVELINDGLKEDRPCAVIQLNNEDESIPSYLYIFNHEGKLCLKLERYKRV